MAGIAAANTNNGTGIAGVAYSGVKIMPVQVLGADGTGQDSDIIEGVVWRRPRRRRHPHVLQQPRLLARAAGGCRLRLGQWRRPGGGDRQRWLQHRELPSRRPWRDRRFSTNENDALSSSSNYGLDVFLAAPGTGSPRPTMAAGTPASPAPRPRRRSCRAAALMRATPAASNGVIAGAWRAAPTRPARRIRQATPAQPGPRDHRHWYHIVKPAGAAPVGSGGPFVGPYVAAEMRQLTARIRDASTNPISGATVTCTTTSGCNGTFTATTAANGTYSLAVNFSGNSANLTLTASKTGYTNWHTACLYN